MFKIKLPGLSETSDNFLGLWVIKMIDRGIPKIQECCVMKIAQEFPWTPCKKEKF